MKVLFTALFCAIAMSVETDCLQSASKLKQLIIATHINSYSNADDFITSLIQVIRGLPHTVDKCSHKRIHEELTNYLPENCIGDIEKTLKLSAVTSDAKDARPTWIFFDTGRLNNIVKYDLTGECSFLENFDIDSLVKNKKCNQEARSFSSELLKDKDRQIQTFEDLDSLLKGIGKVLGECGDPEYGKLIGTIIDPECLAVFDDIEKTLTGFERNPDISGMLAKLPKILQSLKNSKQSCPALKLLRLPDRLQTPINRIGNNSL